MPEEPEQPALQPLAVPDRGDIDIANLSLKVVNGQHVSLGKGMQAFLKPCIHDIIQLRTTCTYVASSIAQGLDGTRQSKD